MAETVTVNIVDGANFLWNTEENGRASVQAERIANVAGITGSGATALRRAVDAVKAVVPLFTAYDSDNPFCVARSYTGLGVNPFTNLVRVRIGYRTPQGPGGGDGAGTDQWTITDSTQEVPDRTEYDPYTGAQLYTHWANPNDSNQIIPFFPDMEYPSVLRSIVMTGYVDAALMDLLRTSVRKVNLDTTWMGVDGVAYWKFTNFYTSYPVGATKYLVRCEVKTWGNKDWSTYQTVVDPHTGKRVLMDVADVNFVRGEPYRFGYIERGGLIRLCPYEFEDFSTLFGIS